MCIIVIVIIIEAHFLRQTILARKVGQTNLVLVYHHGSFVRLQVSVCSSYDLLCCG